MLARNALTLGVPHLEIITGTAPEVFANLPRPQAIFIGGGASNSHLLDKAFAALPSGGRLVVNAVTLETEAELIRRFETHGGDLVRLETARVEPLGSFHGWHPALPVTQWSMTKL